MTPANNPRPIARHAARATQTSLILEADALLDRQEAWLRAAHPEIKLSEVGAYRSGWITGWLAACDLLAQRGIIPRS